MSQNIIKKTWPHVGNLKRETQALGFQSTKHFVVLHPTIMGIYEKLFLWFCEANGVDGKRLFGSIILFGTVVTVLEKIITMKSLGLKQTLHIQISYGDID